MYTKDKVGREMDFIFFVPLHVCILGNEKIDNAAQLAYWSRGKIYFLLKKWEILILLEDSTEKTERNILTF